MIRDAAAGDAAAIARIYNHYVLTAIATFEEEPVCAEEMEGRLREVAESRLPWLVAEREGSIVGYAYASKWKGRCGYRFSAETSVYLDPQAGGKGIGTELYERLFAILEGMGLHAAIGGIALPNPGSVTLHEKLGMEKVAHFKEVGFKFGRWIDVGYWQRTFEKGADEA